MLHAVSLPPASAAAALLSSSCPPGAVLVVAVALTVEEVASPGGVAEVLGVAQAGISGVGEGAQLVTSVEVVEVLAVTSVENGIQIQSPDIWKTVHFELYFYMYVIIMSLCQYVL